MGRQHSLAPLTAMRFFAAAAIVVFHLHLNWGLPRPEDTGLVFGIGVDLFFVLSGFILAYTYRRIDGVEHGLRIIAYRIARIWPLHIVTLGLFYLLLYNPADPFHDVANVWASVLLIQSWFGDYTHAFNGNSVAWTLSLEMFFYLTFPFLTILSSRWIVAVTLLVTAATLAWAFAMPLTGISMDSPGATGVAIARMHPGSFFLLFTSGIVAGRLFLSRAWRLEGAAATACEVLCLLLATVYFMRNQEIAGLAARYLHIQGIPALWMHNAMGAVFFTPLIFVLAIGRGEVSRLLSTRPLLVLGEASFATYLLHIIVQDKIQALGFVTTSSIPAYLAIVLTGSLLLNRYVEIPSSRFLRRKIDDWAGRPVAAVAPVV